jgi:hypothetical protein
MTGLENVGVRSKRKERKHYDEHQDYVELGSTYWCVLRREFSGMIHWLTINNPSNPQQPIQQPYVKRTSQSGQMSILLLIYHPDSSWVSTSH